jgi:ATP phosphoribosyltransferase
MARDLIHPDQDIQQRLRHGAQQVGILGNKVADEVVNRRPKGARRNNFRKHESTP